MACKSNLCDEHAPAYPPVHVYEKGHRCRQDWCAVDMVVAVDSAETWSRMKQFDTHSKSRKRHQAVSFPRRVTSEWQGKWLGVLAWNMRTSAT